MKNIICGLVMGMTFFCSFSQSPFSWINGRWEGTGYQLNLNSTWTIRFIASPGNYQIEYPSLECGGKWTLIEERTGGAVFSEKIEQGIIRCLDLGRAVITLVDENHISFSYFHGDDGVLGSFSTLERVPEN